MSLLLIYAGSLLAAFVGWYACGPIGSTLIRGIARASLVAFLCAPGVLIGHGIAPAPTLFALVVQPWPFTLSSIGVAWLIALAVIFGVPALRRQKNRWPPSLQEAFIDGYAGKLLLLGVVSAISLLATQTDFPDQVVIEIISYLLAIAATAFNFWICFVAAKSRNVNPYLTPLWFAAPVLLVAPPPVAILWYGGGIVGTLVASGRRATAAWLASAVCALLAARFGQRSIMAIDAPPHVNIEGGAGGNAAIAAAFILLAIVSWWLLYRESTSDRG